MRGYFMGNYEKILDLKQDNALSQIISYITPCTKILEMGAYSGRLTKYLKEELNCLVDIVEIDDEAGAKAQKYARNSFLGQEHGDIEKYLWEKSLEDQKYDYIIFADVLEHLTNPETALERCKKFLTSTGCILCSIPNIAHNSILINLYYNTFRYTDTGLLDSTHRWFCGLNDLRNVSEKLGYSIADIKSVNVEPEYTEQAKFFDWRYHELDDFLQRREFGNAYQIVFKLQLQEPVKIENNLSAPINKMEVVIEKDHLLETIDENIYLGQKVKKEIRISAGETKILIHPTIGCPCYVKDLVIETKAQIVTFSSNCIEEYQDSGLYVFLTNYPEYQMSVNSIEAEKIRIEYELQLISRKEALDQFHEVQSKKMQQAQSLIQDLRRDNQILNEQRELLTGEKETLISEKGVLETTKKEIENELTQLKQKIDEFKETLIGKLLWTILKKKKLSK